MATVLSKYTNSRDNNFNLIRFVAASFVLFTHSFALATGSVYAEPLRDSLGMTWGNIAVDVFFVTSGFLIASSFFKKNNIIAFAWARVLRIYPALIVAMLFSVFIVGLIFTSYTASEYLSNPVTYQYFFKNITLFFGVNYYLPGVYEGNPYKYVVNGSLWTLPYEVKMYAYLLIIGTVLVFIQRRQNKNVIKMGILSIALLAITLNFYTYFLLAERINGIHLFSMFFIGTAFYVFREKIHLSLKLFLFIIFVFLFAAFDKQVFFVIYAISLPYLVFYIAYVPSGRIRNFNKFGDYSYGMYIYAFPVQQSIAAVIPNVSVITMILLSFCITFVLAYLSWHFVEKRFLKMKDGYIVVGKAFRNVRLAIPFLHVK